MLGSRPDKDFMVRDKHWPSPWQNSWSKTNLSRISSALFFYLSRTFWCLLSLSCLRRQQWSGHEMWPDSQQIAKMNFFQHSSVNAFFFSFSGHLNFLIFFYFPKSKCDGKRNSINKKWNSHMAACLSMGMVYVRPVTMGASDVTGASWGYLMWWGHHGGCPHYLICNLWSITWIQG